MNWGGWREATHISFCVHDSLFCVHVFSFVMFRTFDHVFISWVFSLFEMNFGWGSKGMTCKEPCIEHLEAGQSIVRSILRIVISLES